MRIHPSVPHRVDETPASLVSRLAFLHRAESVRVFSLDMGVPFQSVVDGHPGAMANLADLVGVPARQISDAAIVRSNGAFSIRGQDVVKPLLRRDRPAVCPRCLAEDLGEDAGPWMASCRVQWALHPVRTCQIHRVDLVEVQSADKIPPHDFARLIEPMVGSIVRLAQEAGYAEPSSLEAYLLDRLDGSAGPDWLDALPWHAAAKACEMIGAVATLGREAPIKTMTNSQWREAGGVGFEIASKGASGIRAFFDTLRTTYPQGRSDPTGPQAWLGRIHTWLGDTRLPGFDPLRDIVVDMVAESSPVGLEDRLYGRPIVDRRRLHSIRTAALETGLHPKRLRRILAACGTIPLDHGAITDDRLLFSAPDAEATLLKAKHAISERDAESYLNAGRVQTKVLAKAGFIRPFVASGRAGLKDAAYDTRELDGFLARLTAKAETMMFHAEPIYRIPEAAKRTNCSSTEIVQAILEDRMEWVGRIDGEHGYMSVLVDVNEVRGLVRGDHGDRLPLANVQAALRTTFGVVDALIRTGLLPSERVISPLNRCPYTAVCQRDLDAFLRTYGSLHDLARERGMHFAPLKRALTDRGIGPAFGKPAVPATFYRRSDIPANL